MTLAFKEIDLDWNLLSGQRRFKTKLGGQNARTFGNPLPGRGRSPIVHLSCVNNRPQCSHMMLPSPRLPWALAGGPVLRLKEMP